MIKKNLHQNTLKMAASRANCDTQVLLFGSTPKINAGN